MIILHFFLEIVDLNFQKIVRNVIITVYHQVDINAYELSSIFMFPTRT